MFRSLTVGQNNYLNAQRHPCMQTLTHRTVILSDNILSCFEVSVDWIGPRSSKPPSYDGNLLVLRLGKPNSLSHSTQMSIMDKEFVVFKRESTWPQLNANFSFFELLSSV